MDRSSRLVCHQSSKEYGCMGKKAGLLTVVSTLSSNRVYISFLSQRRHSPASGREVFGDAVRLLANVADRCL